MHLSRKSLRHLINSDSVLWSCVVEFKINCRKCIYLDP